MVVMGFAITFMTAMGTSQIARNKDVRICPRRRNSMIRDWGEEEQRPLIGKAVGHKVNPEKFDWY